ncbi:restriction endonuclease subunit S [Legionella pneumophila serogroup 3]
MISRKNKVKLAEIINHKKGFAFKSKDYLQKGTPVIRVSNFTENSISPAELKFVSEEIAETNRNVALKEHDIVIATVGSWPNNPASVVGKTICVPKWAKNALMNQNAVIIRVKSECVVDQKFLYYQLKSKSFSNHIIAKAQGSANQASITLDSIFSYELDWPSVLERKKIVEILGALDDRIDLIHETNTTLESIAQALFQSWFIDFDPVRAKAEGREPEGMDAETAALFPDSFEESDLGAIPKNWYVTNLGDAYEINPIRKLKKGELAPYLDMANVPTRGHHAAKTIMREMGSGTKFINGDTLLARITPCLENGKTAFVDFLDDNQIGWGSTEFVVLRPKVPIPPYHGYLLARYSPFREFAIQSMSGTSGRQRIQSNVLSRYLITIPSEALLKVFGSVVSSIQQKITANSRQAMVLEQQRDTLLPRLISGNLQLSI